jgi:hypothetical protein
MSSRKVREYLSECFGGTFLSPDHACYEVAANAMALAAELEKLLKPSSTAYIEAISQLNDSVCTAFEEVASQAICYLVVELSTLNQHLVTAPTASRAVQIKASEGTRGIVSIVSYGTSADDQVEIKTRSRYVISDCDVNNTRTFSITELLAWEVYLKPTDKSIHWAETFEKAIKQKLDHLHGTCDTTLPLTLRIRRNNTRCIFTSVEINQLSCGVLVFKDGLNYKSL